MVRNFLDRFGPWAVVTGASSGIGEAFARRLAATGMNLVLVARREDRLRKLADELQRQHAVAVRVVGADLSRADFLPAIERATADLQVGLLVNNAGVATPGQFLDNDLDAELSLLHVNTRAPLILAHHFGRSMRRLGRGGMIFVASTLAFSAVPGWSNYAASKAYVLPFAEGIAKELKPNGISVLAVCPGPTRTELWPSGTRLSMAMEPGAVVEIALKKLGRRTSVVTGWLNRLTVVATRLLPRSWNATIFGRVVRGMLRGVHAPNQPEPATREGGVGP
ncbi:MAG TPA: SDR family oxidoreductase [Gemmataceae bacterium]|nr:SDR family oxidoreductase [Gemmataceae bacterium]